MSRHVAGPGHDLVPLGACSRAADRCPANFFLCPILTTKLACRARYPLLRGVLAARDSLNPHKPAAAGANRPLVLQPCPCLVELR